MQQDAARWRETKARKGVAMLQRPLHRLPQSLLDVHQAADVIPANSAAIHLSSTHHRRLHRQPCRSKVLHVNAWWGGWVGRGRHRRPCSEACRERSDRRLTAQGGEVGAGEAVTQRRERGHVDVGAQRHDGRVGGQDGNSLRVGGHPDRDLAVQPAGAAYRGVQRVGAVGGADDQEVSRRGGVACSSGPPCSCAVQQRQKLRHDAPFVRSPLAAPRRQRVDLVQQHHHSFALRRSRLGGRKRLPQPPLRLALEGAENGRGGDSVQLRAALPRERRHRRGLACAGGALQQDPPRPSHAQMRRLRPETRRPLDELPQRRQHVVHPAKLPIGRRPTPRHALPIQRHSRQALRQPIRRASSKRRHGVVRCPNFTR
mmetsp:Transcript_34748/g.86975  ORF Transcript_34748/g.86975 Transcript_34748/m.86975 type:complete len:371 (-) Transcript_34748:804-1916(-)